MLKYLTLFSLGYLGTLLGVNILLSHKASVGLISWLQLLYVKIKKPKFTISIGSISLQIRPLYLLHYKNLKATHHDGLIVFHIYKLKIDMGAPNPTLEKDKPIAKKKQPLAKKKHFTPQSLVRILNNISYFLPFTFIIHNSCIVNGKTSIQLETISASFNITKSKDKKTSDPELKLSGHLNISNLKVASQKIIKDIKWTTITTVPINENPDFKFKKITASFVTHSTYVDINVIKSTMAELFSRGLNSKSTASPDSSNIQIVKPKVSNRTPLDIDSILNKFEISDIYFAFDNTEIVSNDERIHVTDMVYGLHKVDKNDVVYKKYSSDHLHKLTINITSFQVCSKLLKDSKLQVEFTNISSIWDMKSLIFISQNIRDTEIIRAFTSDDTFVARSFVTVTNATIFATLDDMLILRKHKIDRNSEINKNDKKPIKVEIPEEIEKSKVLLKNILMVTHKLRTRAQMVTSLIQVKLRKNLTSQFLIDDVLFDSSLTDNIASLFEANPSFTPIKSVFTAVRNVQLCVLDGPMLHKLIIIDIFDASCSIEVKDDEIIVDGVNLYTHHLEILTQNIVIFKKLAAIATEVINSESINVSKKIDKAEPVVNTTINNEKPPKPISSSKKTRKDSIIPKFVHTVSALFHRVTFVGCFENPVKYWDNRDQSELNQFKRGFSIALYELQFKNDNTVDVPVLDLKLDDLTLNLIRDYDNEKFNKQFTRFFNLKNYHLKYTYLNNRLSMVFPIIDMVISVEVLWSIFFVMAVLKSLKGRRNGDHLEGQNLKKTEKKVKDPIDKLHVLVGLHLLILKVELPSDIELAVELDSLEYINFPSSHDFSTIKFRVFRIYGQNAHAENMWNLICILNNARIKINAKKEIELAEDEEKINIICDAIRIEIPFEYIFYKTFDNLKAFLKSIKKLKLNFHDMMFVEDDDKIFKVNVIHPSECLNPTEIPKMRIETKHFLYCNHDDPFEESLTGCLMLGKLEQKVRIAKLREFEKYEKKMNEILEIKYQSLLFKDGIAKRPDRYKEKKIKLASSLPPPVQRASSPSISTHRRSISKGKVGNGYTVPTSRLANEVLSNEEEEWVAYCKDYHDSIEIPKSRLLSNISKSWLMRVNTSRKFKINEGSSNSRKTGGIMDPQVRSEFMRKFPIVVEGNIQPLFGFAVNDLILDLNEPKFGRNNYPDFLYKVGNKMPKDSKYGILVPMNLKLACSCMRIQIKDYPLPLLSFGGAVSDLSDAVKFSGDFVVFEQMYVPEEIRFNFVPCVPQYYDPLHQDNFYAFHISRTMTNIKFVTDMNVNVISEKAAIVSWAPSLQPALGYAMTSFDVLSKPPLDLSPKIGFWDKIPLLVHAKFLFTLKNGIDLFIKASESPYDLVGQSAGFVFKWDKNVHLKINSNGRPEDFLIVESEVFEIGIPVFESSYFMQIMNQGTGTAFNYTIAKPVLKLRSRPIIWKMGFIFERNLSNDKNAIPGNVARTREFVPHYQVRLRNPDTFTTNEVKENWDAFEGWRSDYIYMAVSLTSKAQHTGSEYPIPECQSYNSLHLSPLTFSHFFNWWSVFHTNLGLPIKAGNIFENKFVVNTKSPKFGSHIYGIGYSIQLSPLYLTHVYRHSSAASANSKVAFTGLKCLVKSFTMDLHQCRREVTLYDEKTESTRKEWHLKMDKGIVDFEDADLRILTAVFDQASAAGILARQIGLDSSSSNFSSYDSASSISEKSEFCSHTWYDKNDFIEIEAPELPAEDPKWKVTEFASSPRFYYVREEPEVDMDFPFDKIEKETHHCQLGKRHVSHAASDLTSSRIHELEQHIKFHKEEISDIEKKSQNEFSKQTLKKLNDSLLELHHRLHVLRCLKDKFTEGIFPEYDEFVNDSDLSDDEIEYELSRAPTRVSSHLSRIKSRISVIPQKTSNYRNRFSVYSINVKWTHHIRHGFMKYLENIKNRRFLVFSLSQKAINLAEDLSKLHSAKSGVKNQFSDQTEEDPEVQFEKSRTLLDDFDMSLHDTGEYVNAETDDTYLLKFILPQVCLSNDNSNCVLLMSNQIVSRSVTVKGYENETSVDNEIAIPMETRTGLTVTDAFAYVLEKEKVLGNQYNMFSSRASMWPPILPIELYYTPGSLDDCVIVQDISCGILLVEPNKLHYGKHDSSNVIKCKKTIRIVAPEVNITVDSKQYGVVFDCATSLMQTEKTEIQKVKDAVKNFVKFSDFEDFDDIADKLAEMQHEARQLMECKRVLSILNNVADEDICQEITTMNVELERINLNLNALVDLLQKSKAQKFNDSYEYTQWVIMAPTVKLLLMNEGKQPFVDIDAIDACYMFTTAENGASKNKVYVYDFAIFDKHPEAVYETVMRRLDDSNRPLCVIDWTMSDPVGGIEIIEDKLYSFAPLKVELDIRFAKSLQRFLFPDSTLHINENKMFEDEGADSLFDDLSSSDSDESSMRRSTSNSSFSSTSTENLPKSQGKFSRTLSKILNRGKSLHSRAESVKSTVMNHSPSNMDESHGIAFTNQETKNNLELNCTQNVKEMERRSKTYQMGHYVVIDAIKVCLTFKGTGALRMVNLADFVIETPKIELNDRMISNEELITIVRARLVQYVLKNTHNVIRSKFRTSKKSTGASLNPQINPVLRVKKQPSKKDEQLEHHTHEHHLHAHKFYDPDLLEPVSQDEMHSNPIHLAPIVDTTDNSNVDLDESHYFAKLDEINEESDD